MRNMPLNELKKKNNAYFRKIGIITPVGRTKQQIEYIVNRSYESLSKRAKQYIEDRQQIVNAITNAIIAGGEDGQMNPYQALKSYAMQRERSQGGGTARDIYRRFRLEDSRLYSKYNSYMYRLGYSGSAYFYDNVGIDQEGSTVIATLDLPPKTSGVIYEQLVITFDYSAQDFWAEMQ